MGKKLHYLGVYLVGDIFLGTFIEMAFFPEDSFIPVSTLVGFLVVTGYYAANNIDRLKKRETKAWGWTAVGIFMILVWFIAGGAMYTYSGVGESTDLSAAEPMIAEDFTYSPPKGWKQYTYSENNTITQLADRHRLYTPGSETETGIIFMTYKTSHNHSSFFENESIDNFFEQVKMRNRGKDFELLDQQVQEINGTDWLTYNYSMQRNGKPYKIHYQVSVSSGNYYALGYFAPEDKFSQRYGEAVSTMRDAILLTPIPKVTVEEVEVPEIEPVEVITPRNRNFSTTVTLQPDYWYRRNLTLEGKKEISWNATEYVTVSLWKTSEFLEAIEDDPASEIFKNDASKDEKELDLEKGNYTLVALNEETETVNATLKVQTRYD